MCALFVMYREARSADNHLDPYVRQQCVLLCIVQHFEPRGDALKMSIIISITVVLLPPRCFVQSVHRCWEDVLLFSLTTSGMYILPMCVCVQR